MGFKIGFIKVVGVSNELSEGYRVMNPVFYTRRPGKNHSLDIKIALTWLILVLETRPGYFWMRNGPNRLDGR